MIDKKQKFSATQSYFTALLVEVKDRIQSAQMRAVLTVSAELVRLYWDIGRIIHERQQLEGWGAGVIPRLARALHNEMPELKGFSERNIGRMIAFYREYPTPSVILPQPAAKIHAPEKGPQPAAQLTNRLFWSLPWFHHVILMEKIKDLPIGVSEYQLTRALPKALRSSLPSIKEIEAELSKVKPRLKKI
jgi:DUF1016 N-terminal domain